MRWTLTVEDERGTLADVRTHVDRAVEAVRVRVDGTVPAVDLAIVVRAGARVIPEIGLVGHAPRPGLVILTLDPANPMLAKHLGRTLERMVAHELHHALRWDALGLDAAGTLLDALVAEGLAGRFVNELYGNAPEPWERALGPSDIARLARDALEEADAPDYDHDAWFFGRGNKPRWAGYTLGYRLVGAFCDAMGRRPSELAGRPAWAFRDDLVTLGRQGGAA